ncbi:unnamed protein product [Urochloa humidicola]
MHHHHHQQQRRPFQPSSRTTATPLESIGSTHCAAKMDEFMDALNDASVGISGYMAEIQLKMRQLSGEVTKINYESMKWLQITQNAAHLLSTATRYPSEVNVSTTWTKSVTNGESGVMDQAVSYVIS